MVRKPARRASEQINIRVSPEEAAIIRAAIPRGDLTPIVARLLLEEARSRLQDQNQLQLFDGRAISAA